MPIPKIDIIIEPKRALQKPSTEKPGVKNPANINKRAFKIRLKRPKVNIFMGNVITCKTGFINIFISAKIIATTSAPVNPSTLIPGTIQAVNIITNA